MKLIGQGSLHVGYWSSVSYKPCIWCYSLWRPQCTGVGNPLYFKMSGWKILYLWKFWHDFIEASKKLWLSHFITLHQRVQILQGHGCDILKKWNLKDKMSYWIDHWLVIENFRHFFLKGKDLELWQSILLHLRALVMNRELHVLLYCTPESFMKDWVSKNYVYSLYPQ